MGDSIPDSVPTGYLEPIPSPHTLDLMGLWHEMDLAFDDMSGKFKV